MHVHAKFGKVESTHPWESSVSSDQPPKLHEKTCLIVNNSAADYSISLKFCSQFNRMTREVKVSACDNMQKFSKLSIIQPEIARFRSNLVQTLITSRLMYHKLSRSTSQRSRSQRGITYQHQKRCNSRTYKLSKVKLSKNYTRAKRNT